MNFSNLCETCIKNGENIVVVIENYDWVKNIFATFDKDVSNRIGKYIEETFSKIAKLGNVVLLFSVENDLQY